MKLLLLACCLIIAISGYASSATQRYASRVDHTHDQVLQRVIVPATENPQGEIQLVQRGDLRVVRTLLASRLLKRVVAAIDNKEERNWPETNHNFSDSDRYRDELFNATDLAWQKFQQRSDPNERRQFLSIEFILASDKGFIALALPRLSGEYGQFRLIDQQVLSVWRSSHDYVRSNMLQIIKENFQPGENATEMLLPSRPGN